MTSRDFCFWLQGFFEISEPTEQTGHSNASIGLTDKQARMIKRHLALVFKHEIDSSFGDQGKQDELNAIHGNAPSHPSRPSDLVVRC